MTTDELLAIIDKMDATDADKAAMRQQVRDGDPNTSFAVYAIGKLQEAQQS